MLSYLGSRLASTDTADSHAIRRVFNALGKRVRIHPRERLFMEVEISIPRDISDLGSRSGQVRVAEVVLKLVKQLKAGPLNHFKNDREYLAGAIEFLATDKGRIWVRSWFLPDQMGPASHEVRAKIPMAQLPNIPPGATTRVLSPRGSSSDTRSPRSTHNTGFLGLLSSPTDVSPLSVRGIKTAVSTAPLGPGVNQYRRAHSDSDLLSLPSRQKKPNYKFYGESFHTIPSSAIRLSLGDIESGRIAKNEKSPVQIAQCYFHLLVMLLFFLLILFLARSMGIDITSNGGRDCKWTEGC